MQQEWNVSSRELVTLTTAMYVLGLGIGGPLAFAPTSELYGRQLSYATSMLGQLW